MLFGQSIQYAVDIAQDIERAYGVQLLPALLILSVMLVFHQHSNRRETQAEAQAAAVEARLATRRADELEQLMRFGQSLAGALSVEALREAIRQHLPTLTAGPDTWVLLRSESGWDRLVDVSCSRWSLGEIEAIADAAGPPSPLDRADGFEHDGHLCFVMHIGHRAVGVMGLPSASASGDTHHTMAAAAALLTVALRNAQLFADVRDHSVKDQLTGCYNRAHAIEMLDAELARARRTGTPLSILLFDVDRFKRINDRYGHTCGDIVLTAVGQRIHHVLRRSDMRCRYGGDEFLVVLPETPPGGAVRVAEWLRAEMDEVVVARGADRITVTISIGIATVDAGNSSVSALISRADEALYQAKARGRNCVRMAADPEFDRELSIDRTPFITTH